MSSRSATARIAASETQPSCCSWTRHRIGMTAEGCRPSGYLAICCFAQARLSSEKANFAGCSSFGARRRTDIVVQFLMAWREDAAPNTSWPTRDQTLAWPSMDKPALRSNWMATAGSPIDLSEHDIERAEDGRDVGQQMAFADVMHCLQMGKARRADLALVRLVGAISDQEDAELAFGRFNRNIDLARRDMEPFGV